MQTAKNEAHPTRIHDLHLNPPTYRTLQPATHRTLPPTYSSTLKPPESIPGHRRTSHEEAAPHTNIGTSIRRDSNGKIVVMHPMSVVDRQHTICLMPDCEYTLQR